MLNGKVMLSLAHEGNSLGVSQFDFDNYLSFSGAEKKFIPYKRSKYVFCSPSNVFLFHRRVVT
jgi:hypothetical protein